MLSAQEARMLSQEYKQVPGSVSERFTARVLAQLSVVVRQKCQQGEEAAVVYPADLGLDVKGEEMEACMSDVIIHLKKELGYNVHHTTGQAFYMISWRQLI